MPEWLKSPGRNSAGGGSDQRKSCDVQESRVNEDRDERRARFEPRVLTLFKGMTQIPQKDAA